VVVGGSIGAVRTVQALRREGYGGRIRLLTEELVEPYDRPPLSKQYLAGSRSLDQFTLLTQEEAGKLDVEMMLGVRAVGIDPDWDVVELADGSRLSYEHLVIATGSSPRATPWDTVEGVLSLRDLQDADQLRRALDSATSIAVVGAGFVGAEVAATARGLGVEVTMIDPLPHPMARVLGGTLAERFIKLHQDRGVQFLLSTRVESIQKNTSGIQLSLSDSTTLTCDVVIVGIGTLPNTEWLSGSGLQLTPGLECDATLTAVDDADILGAGDIVSWPHPLAGGEAIRIEHWTVAAEQGQQAGRNVLLPVEERKPYDQPPYFWSDQYDTKIQSLGLPGRAARLELLEETEDGSRFVYGGERDGRLVGVIAINAARRLGSYRMALADPPGFEDLRAGIAADQKALGAPARAA